MSRNFGTSGSESKALATTTDWTFCTGPNAIGNNPVINNYSGFSALPQVIVIIIGIEA